MAYRPASSIKGEVSTALMIALAAVALLLPQNWRPTNWAIFQKAPPTKELAIAQADLEKARAEAASAVAISKASEEALKAIQKADEDKRLSQLRYSQQMASGAKEALSKAPSSARTPEVVLASSLLDRTTLGLAAAIGDLPEDRQKEIVQIVANSLSAVQEELDIARIALKIKDMELNQTKVDRVELVDRISKLASESENNKALANAKTAEANAKTGEVREITGKVVSYAEKLAAKERESGSLKSQLSSYLRIAIAVGIGWILLALFVPGFIKHLKAGWFKTTLRNIAGYITSPLLFSDAKDKIPDTTT